MGYSYYIYDTYLNEKFVGKLPINYKDYDEYNFEFLSKDFESFIVSDHLAKEFKDCVINYVKDTRVLLNFIRAYIYEINFDIQKISNNFI